MLKLTEIQKDFILIWFVNLLVFSVEREWAGLRRICGYGVSVTRGAASAMMFTYSSLLVTMCRNTITALRETALHRYIPFDSAVPMHRLIAWIAIIVTGTSLCNCAVDYFCVQKKFCKFRLSISKENCKGFRKVLIQLFLLTFKRFKSKVSKNSILNFH